MDWEGWFKLAMYDGVSMPAFERSAVAEAFERQARGMGGGGAVSM